MDTVVQPRATVRFGSFELDATSGELRENGVARPLAAQPFRVLVLLTEHAGQTVTRLEIQRCLWGDRKYVEVDHGINFCLNQIRRALRDPAETSAYIKTLPRQGYRFVAATSRTEITAHSEPEPASAQPGPPANGGLGRAPRGAAIAVALLLLFAVSLGVVYSRYHRPSPRTKQAVLIDDFANLTGDAVFDDTLRQALSIELGQSNYFDVLSDAKAHRTLTLMGSPGDQRITAEAGRKICLRTGTPAVLEGKIVMLGSHYLLSVNAIGCATGEPFASAQAEATRKEDVLGALSLTASRLRTQLGESLPSVQKFDAPMEATTSSLEALKSYSIGHQVALLRGDVPSLPFFQRAIELDPQFSLAYTALAARYSNLGEPALALGYATQAYRSANRGTERERLLALTLYLRLLGNVEKLTQTLDTWKLEYPRDGSPYGSQGANFVYMGQYVKALAEWRQALALQPDNVAMYDNLGTIYLALKRPAEAHAIIQSARIRGMDSAGLRLTLYHLAFSEADPGTMSQQIDWAIGKPGIEDQLLAAQAETVAYAGRLREAGELSRRAVNSAVNADLKEKAAVWQILAALREAEFGALAAADSDIAKALAIASGRNVNVLAALALARIGRTADARVLLERLTAAEPDNTAMTMFRLPSIEAAIALGEGSPLRAIDALEAARPSELGLPSPSGIAPLYPSYLRGLAYLSLRRGSEAVREFRTLVENPGIALNSPLAALAQLGIARGLVLANDPSAAKLEYRKFLSAWHDADEGIPVLAAARAEFAALGQR